jgi:hypothetical protein
MLCVLAPRAICLSRSAPTTVWRQSELPAKRMDHRVEGRWSSRPSDGSWPRGAILDPSATRSPLLHSRLRRSRAVARCNPEGATSSQLHHQATVKPEYQSTLRSLLLCVLVPAGIVALFVPFLAPYVLVDTFVLAALTGYAVFVLLRRLAIANAVTACLVGFLVCIALRVLAAAIP